MWRSGSSPRSGLQRGQRIRRSRCASAGQPDTAARLRPLTAQCRRRDRDRLLHGLPLNPPPGDCSRVRRRRQWPPSAAASTATRRQLRRGRERLGGRPGAARASTLGSGTPRPSARSHPNNWALYQSGNVIPTADRRSAVRRPHPHGLSILFNGGGAGRCRCARFAGFYVTGWSSASNACANAAEQRGPAARTSPVRQQSRRSGDTS